MRRIEERLLQYSQNGIPANIQQYAQAEDIIRVFQNIISNKDNYYDSISEDITIDVTDEYVNQDDHGPVIINITKSHRVDKGKLQDKPFRTFYILQDKFTNEIILILQTKQRLASGLKARDKEVRKGGTKTAKDAWRLDCQVPQAWVSLSIKIKSRIKPVLIEADVTEDIYLDAKRSMGDEVPFLYLLTTKIHRKKFKDKLTLFSRKIDQSMWDLLTDSTIAISHNDAIKIALTVLDGVNYLHGRGITHQDLSAANILISKNFNPYIIDFGLADSQKYRNGACSPRAFDSPELAASKNLLRLRNNDEFFPSFGKFLIQGMPQDQPLGHPHPANDMWALGIDFAALMTRDCFDLITTSNVSHFTFNVLQASIRRNPFYAGLLAKEREKRFTAQQAIDCLTANPEYINLKLVDLSHNPQFQEMKRVEELSQQFFTRILDRTKGFVPLTAINPLFIHVENADLLLIYKYLNDYRRNIRFLITSKAMRQGTDVGYFLSLPEKMTGLQKCLHIVFSHIEGFMLLMDGMPGSAIVYRIDCVPCKQYTKEKVVTDDVLVAIQEVRLIENLNSGLKTPLFWEKNVGSVEEHSPTVKFSIKLFSKNPAGTLLNLIYDHIEPEQVQIIIATVLNALKVMHDKGFVHQGLQLSNIYYYQTEKNMRQYYLSGLGKVGCINGMSHADPAADMWAVGMILLKMLVEDEVVDQEQLRRFICNHPLLSGLLQPHPSKRFTVATALEVFRTCPLIHFSPVDPLSFQVLKINRSPIKPFLYQFMRRKVKVDIPVPVRDDAELVKAFDNLNL